MKKFIETIIFNKETLKELYPNGFQDFFLDNICLYSDNSDIWFTLWVKDKPKNPHSEWGVWNKDYNVVILRFSCGINKKICIDNWQNNFIKDITDKCLLKVSIQSANDYGIKDEKDCTLIFTGENWKVNIITKALAFQGAKVCFYSNDPEYL